jgi:hypothetical protein
MEKSLNLIRGLRFEGAYWSAIFPRKNMPAKKKPRRASMKRPISRVTSVPPYLSGPYLGQVGGKYVHLHSIKKHILYAKKYRLQHIVLSREK